MADRAAGGDELLGLPAFPHRRFRHGYVFVPAVSDIGHPAEFAGSAVGVRTWQNTAGIWVRGMLAEHYGLDLGAVRWIAQDPESAALLMPRSMQLHLVPERAPVTEHVRCRRLGRLRLNQSSTLQPFLRSDIASRSRTAGWLRSTEQAQACC